MTTLITGIIGLLILVLFTGGLAKSIAQNPAHGGIPFLIIVVFICGLAIYGFYEEYKEERENKE